jgi:hypothetical protein
MFKNNSPQVLVRHNGDWVKGRLIDTITDLDGLWQGLVRFTTTDGRRRREWHHVTDLRPTTH